MTFARSTSRMRWNLQNFILTCFTEKSCSGSHLASICVPGVRFWPFSKRSNLYIISSYFRPSECNGAVLFLTGSHLLKKRPVGPTFAPETSDAYNLAFRPPNDACRQALNSLWTPGQYASSKISLGPSLQNVAFRGKSINAYKII